MTDQGAIDLSVDLGEVPTASGYQIDQDLLALASSAHIATGGHVGDRDTMRRALNACQTFGVAVGGHPSYPDPEGFGRRPTSLSIAAVIESLCEQLATLEDLASSEGVRVVSIKPHGQMYHDLETRPELAEALFSAISAMDSVTRVVLQCGSLCGDLARRFGLDLVAEGFCDRRYESGRIVERSQAKALLDEPQAAAAQAIQLARHGLIIDEVHYGVDSLCLHSDSPGVEARMRAVRAALIADGLSIRVPQ